MGSARRSPRFVLVGSAVALALLLFPAKVSVQDALQAPTDDPLTHDWSQDVPAHFTVVEGQVMLERDARLEPAEPNQIVMAGDRLRTTTGRTEILFADGSTLQVDESSEVDFMSDSLLRLNSGRVRLMIKRDNDKLDYRVDSVAGHVEIKVAGDYRIALGSDKRGKPEIDLTVFRGTAELVNENGRTSVRAGKYAVTSADTEPSLPYSFNSASQDEFDQWVQALRDAQVVNASSPSAQNLPQEVSYYANTMDAYGTWSYQEPYGAVWYPTVAVGWYPYWQGRWAYSKHYAWTWLGLDHWAWPTYHYGSWGYGSAGWYWAPGHAYSPAWVTWGYAPGYVGWCPVGPGGGPGYGWGGGGPRPTPHNGNGPWTVMPAGSMGHNTWVTENAIRPDQMPLNARAAFREQRSGPAPSGTALAVARRDLPSIGSPTVPRGMVASPRSASIPGAGSGNAVQVIRGSQTSTADLSAFPASRNVMGMPDANARADSRGSNAAPRAVPNGVETNRGSNGFPSSRTAMPDATRSVPRAEVSSGFGRASETQRQDGFPSSGAVRAVPKGLEGQSNVPVMRAEPSSNSRGSNGSSGSNGYRAVPPGVQSAPTVDRGRSVPRNDAPAAAPTQRPVMAAPSQPVQRSMPQASAPSSSVQAVPRGVGHSAGPAPASAPPAAVSAPPTRGSGGAASAPPPSQGAGGAATARRGGGRGGK